MAIKERTEWAISEDEITKRIGLMIVRDADCACAS
jgi:hypothetical protein